ncbi:MAG: substrate-binding domain-containing protein, partial [Clostridia bacterium]|nr:substrate-binding domain-containing protein [Clostridia bacterium]
MKKLVSILLVLALSLSLLCTATAEAPKKVGVAMPTMDLQRWIQDGENMKKQLEAAGYEVDLQYANNDVATQVSQIENMLLNEVEVLVVA